jgi:hypothetical protein
MSLRRVAAAGAPALLLVAIVAGAVIAHVPRAQASCAAPAYADARTGGVTACQAVDPDRQPALKRSIQSYRREKHDAYVDQLLAAYRGVLITVDIQQSVRRAPSAPRPRGSVAAWIVDGPGKPGVYFIPTRAPKPCAAFPPGKVLVLDEGVACCDGDANVPCLLRNPGVTAEGSDVHHPKRP